LMVPLLSIVPSLLDAPLPPIVIVLSLSIEENAVLVRTPVPLVSIVPVVTWLLIWSAPLASVPSPLTRVPVIAIAPKLSIVPMLV